MESVEVDELRGIGRMAQETGLSISALRFYDRVGLLVPAEVDPISGYRRYSARQVAPARVVAGLRRVGMPLPEIAAVLAALPDAAAARRLVDAHLRRLEDGLADARRELSRVHDRLRDWETPMTVRIHLSAADLAAALDAVRFAAGADPELPTLAGVLLDATADGLEVAATDRFRLAVARAAAEVHGPPTRAVAPTAFVDELRRRLDGVTGQVELTIAGDDLAAEVGGAGVTGRAVAGEFPDLRRLPLVDAPRHRVTVDVAALRAALAPGAAPLVTREFEGRSFPVAVLAVRPDDGLAVADPSTWDAEDAGTVAVNPEFLLEALDAGGGDQLVLDLDGPIRPLAIRTPGEDGRFSVLMPVRL